MGDVDMAIRIDGIDLAAAVAAGRMQPAVVDVGGVGGVPGKRRIALRICLEDCVISAVALISNCDGRLRGRKNGGLRWSVMPLVLGIVVAVGPVSPAAIRH